MACGPGYDVVYGLNFVVHVLLEVVRLRLGSRYDDGRVVGMGEEHVKPVWQSVL